MGSMEVITPMETQASQLRSNRDSLLCSRNLVQPKRLPTIFGESASDERKMIDLPINSILPILNLNKSSLPFLVKNNLWLGALVHKAITIG